MHFIGDLDGVFLVLFVLDIYTYTLHLFLKKKMKLYVALWSISVTNKLLIYYKKFTFISFQVMSGINHNNQWIEEHLKMISTLGMQTSFNFKYYNILHCPSHRNY